MKTRVNDKVFYKTFFSMTAFIILQNILIYSVNLADNIMIGRYSETAMNGVSLANQIQFLLQMFAMGSANGMSVLTAQYWGKKQIEPIKKIFASAAVFGLGMSLVLSVLVITQPEFVLGLLTDKQDAIAEGAKYIVIMGFTYCIYTMTNLMLGVLRSVETVKIGFVVTALSLVIDVVLNYALIFGNFGFPEMGARGAAIATMTARIVEFIIVSVYVLFFDKKIRFKLHEMFALDKKYVSDFIKSGLPLIGSSVSWGFAMAIQTAILGRLDSDAILGANNIATTLFQVVSVIYTSTSNSSSVIIGKTVGERDFTKVRRYTKKLQILYIIIGVVSAVAMFLTKDAVISLYTISDETVQLARTLIIILCFTIVGSSYEMPCLCGIVSGGGDTKFVLFNDLIFMWGIVLPLSALSAFVFNWPIPVTFLLLKSDQILKCFVAVIKVNRFKWIKELTRNTDECERSKAS